MIATQNPAEFQGTYPLPESQMDRFSLRLSLGFVAIDDEVEILDSQTVHGHPLDALKPIAPVQDMHAILNASANVAISAELKR